MPKKRADFIETANGLPPSKRRSDMTTRLYDFTVDTANAAWMVIETGSGSVACLNGIPQHHLSLAEADDIAALLNRIERAPPPLLG